MKKLLLASVALIGALSFADLADAGCASPTVGSLSGADFSNAQQNVATITIGGKQYPVPVTEGWVSGTNYQPLALDASCNLFVNVAAGSLSITGALPAGTAILGKVGIDQTTPGVTNAVQESNFPAAVATGTGAVNANSPRFAIAVDSATTGGSAPGSFTQPVSGTVIIGNWPGTTTVTGSVSVSNLPSTQASNLIQVGGTAVLTGSGATGAGSQRLTVAGDSATVAGSTPGSFTQPVNGTVFTKPQDSGGGDATDVTNHAIKVTAPLGNIMLGSQYTYTVANAATDTEGTTAYPVNGMLCAVDKSAGSTGCNSSNANSINFGAGHPGVYLTGFKIWLSDGTGWNQGSQMTLKTFSQAPTMSGGDHSPYSLTTGTRYWTGDFNCTFNTPDGDGVNGNCVSVGPAPYIPSSIIYTLLYTPTGSNTTSGTQLTVVLTPEGTF